ncbi:MAG: TraC family protein [Desulfobulbus sp.]|nr:TraC family protein [Desulfobulbus sp.]
MMSLLEKIGCRPSDHLKQADLNRMTSRHSFSAYLNYLAYDDDLGIYLNQDGSLGFLWECTPLTFAGPKTMTSLEGLFRALPKGSVLQLTLHADSHIAPILSAYRESRTVADIIVRTSTEQIVGFMEQGRRGLAACSHIPVRNFRLFVAVKLPGDTESPNPENKTFRQEHTKNLQDIKRQITETLKAALLSPRSMQPGDLLEWARRLFNHYPAGYPEHNFTTYNDTIPLRKQLLNADTVVREASDHLQVGDNFFCCTTPKSIPNQIDPLQTNTLFGGIWGLISDMDQIKTGFLYILNIFFEQGLETKIHAKCNLLLNQQAVGSLSTLLRRKQEEHLAATDALEHGVKFVRIIPILLVWDRDLERARESCTRARRIWEDNGYVMQQDSFILKILFLSALPFCLYTTGRNIDNLERDFIAPVPSVTPLLPVQGDFAGTGGIPKLIFTGRKGQLVSLDFFAKGAANHNIVCCATTGSGKSFLVNFLAFNYYACGALVRIIDIGGSYKKIADMLGARYLDFQPGTTVCLNPFTSIQEPEEELKSVTAVFAQMAYSNSDTDRCDDTELNMIRNAVRWAWQQKGQAADADTVYAFLATFPEVEAADFDSMSDNPSLIVVARKLAFNIREFTSYGFHGRFFTGPSTFDIHRDAFVVLELENLKIQPDLYRVVTLLVLNAVTQDLYLSDRSRSRLIIFDEAWQFMGKAAMLGPVINEGYRRARKYNGSFMIITQSLLDLDSFGEVGRVINGNSAFKIYLESSDFDQARKQGLIEYDDFVLQLLKSIKSNPPKYSEIFFDTPFGLGVARLVVNHYDYFIYTSKPAEIAAIEGMVKNGLTYHEAILSMVDRREQDAL